MATYRHISHGFDPVFDEDSRVLVLGSFPSVLSRKNDFYYGNPQNRFWRVVAACLGKPTPPNAGDVVLAAAPGAGEAALTVAPVAGEHAGSGEPAPGADPRVATLEQSIVVKRELLLSGGIALWDVIESCDIKGSSDASIKNVVPVDISRVLAQARIGAVVCNGATAGRLYKRYLQWEVGLDPHVLPSTSPANAAWSLDRLTERWQEELSALLEDARSGKMAVARGIAKAGADTAPGGAAGVSVPVVGRAVGAASGTDAPPAPAPASPAPPAPASPAPGSPAPNEALPPQSSPAGRFDYAVSRVPTPPASNWAVHKSMQGNKRKDTKPELLVREKLREAGLGGYRLQWKVPGHPDIAWPGKRVAVEVRGCYWHRCPHCNPSTPKKNVPYWEAKFARNVQRDAENLAALEAMGWRVHVIWECELKKASLASTMARLLPQLSQELGKPLRESAEEAAAQPAPANGKASAPAHAEPASGEGAPLPRVEAAQHPVKAAVSPASGSEPAPAPAAAAAGKHHFMYVLECGDASLYTGYTTDVAARLAAHRAGKGAKYTRNRGPLNLLAQAEFATKHEAMSAEARFKRLSRDQKDRLLARASDPDADFAEILRDELSL